LKVLAANVMGTFMAVNELDIPTISDAVSYDSVVEM
jgi:hypothetical protein